jgi:hypothetical protein
MRREQRLLKISELIQAYMKRSDVNDTELGRRIGITRISVRRLRLGEVLPKEETIRKLKFGLQWINNEGVIQELTDDELTTLRNVAGYFEPASQIYSNRTENPDHCIVYSHHHAPDAFPSRWSMRIIKLERVMPGNIYTMWSTLPSITRSPDYYAGAYKQSHYHQDKVEAYMLAHESRQEAFFKRLETASVRHLYSKKGVEDTLRGLSTGGRPHWHFWHIPPHVLTKQLDNLLEWFDRYDNFEIRLRETEVPGNITILSNTIVMIEFSLSASIQTANNTNGLELVGAATTAQFTNQFDNYWADRETIKDRGEVVRWLNQLKSIPLNGKR